MGANNMKKQKLQAKTRQESSNKPLYSRLHAIKRAKERYDMDLDMVDIDRVEFKIRQNYESFFLERSTNSRTVWLVTVEGQLMVTVYNSKQKCLSTFLPIFYAKRYFNGENLPTYDPNYNETK